MTVIWQCECGREFISGREAFLHRSVCEKTCKPVSELEIPMKRITGIEREQMEASC